MRSACGAYVSSARHQYQTVEASVIIDCTELGDIVARLGIACDTGMECGALVGEDVAPAAANGIVQDLTMWRCSKPLRRPWLWTSLRAMTRPNLPVRQ